VAELRGQRVRGTAQTQFSGMSKRPSDEGSKKVMVKDLMINNLGNGGSALESWQNLIREKMRGSEGKASDELKCSLSELLGKADEVCEQLLLERQEMYIESRRENEDLMSHIDLMRKRFAAVSAENSTFREMRKQAAADMEKASQQLRDVSTQYRSLQSQHAATLGQLRHAEASAAERKKRIDELEEQVSASRPHAGFTFSPGDGDGGSGSNVRCEDMELIDDLAEDMLDAAVGEGEVCLADPRLSPPITNVPFEHQVPKTTNSITTNFNALHPKWNKTKKVIEQAYSGMPSQRKPNPYDEPPRGMTLKSQGHLTRTDPQTHQTDDLLAELQRLESRLRAEESRTREVSGQFKACQEQLAEANRKLEAMEIAAKLDEVVSKVKICKPSESVAFGINRALRNHSKITGPR